MARLSPASARVGPHPPSAPKIAQATLTAYRRAIPASALHQNFFIFCGAEFSPCRILATAKNCHVGDRRYQYRVATAWVSVGWGLGEAITKHAHVYPYSIVPPMPYSRALSHDAVSV
jgi:hypothetical protein